MSFVTREKYNTMSNTRLKFEKFEQKRFFGGGEERGIWYDVLKIIKNRVLVIYYKTDSKCYFMFHNKKRSTYT